MTGYTVHTGASKKFVDGWDRIFGDEPQPRKAKKAATRKKKAAKASGRKASVKKSAKKAGKKKAASKKS